MRTRICWFCVGAILFGFVGLLLSSPAKGEPMKPRSVSDELQYFLRRDARDIADRLVADACVDSVTGRATRRVIRRVLLKCRGVQRSRTLRILSARDRGFVYAGDPTAATAEVFAPQVFDSTATLDI